MEELIAKLAKVNADTEAWMAEGPDRWATLYVLDAQHWIDRGINNLEEFDRYDIENTYHELYKDKYGVGPSEFSHLTNEQLEAKITYLCGTTEEAI